MNETLAMVNFEKRWRTLVRGIEGNFLRRAREEKLQASVYCLLVDSIFGTLGAFYALSAAGIIIGGLVYFKHPTITTLVLGTSLVIIAFSRLIMMRCYQKTKTNANSLRLRDAVKWEAIYMILGVPMMGCIGAISSVAVISHDGLLTIVSNAMIMAIGAIIGSRNGGRTKVARYQTTALCLPYGASLLMSRHLDLQVTGVMIVLYYIGILSVIRTTYNTLRNALESRQRSLLMSKRMAAQARLLSAAMDNMNTALMMFGDNGQLLVSNAKAYDLFGEIRLKRLVGHNIREVADHVFVTFGLTKEQANETRSFYRGLGDSLGGATFDLTDHVRGRSLSVRLNQIEDGGGIVISLDDITERKRKDDQIARLAHHDPLTGLDNRYSLLQRLTEAAAKDASVTTGIYIDIDRFKAINDTEGHVFGDKLLIAVGERLRLHTNSVDTVARMGGDEFFVLFGAPSDALAADNVARLLVECIRSPIHVDGKEIQITASAGVAQIAGAFEPESIVSRADAALYEAKIQGRDRWARFEEAMEEKARLYLLLEAELKLAITNQELDLVYQPLVDIDRGQTVCCEALLRWHSPRRGTTAPTVFIPIAERTSLICDLGTWALHRACRDAMTWSDKRVKVSVNISVRHFKSEPGAVSGAIEEALIATGLDPARLQIEITESVLASDMESMRHELESIHARGVSIALDDFGTGYSSLNYIHQLPVDKVKLDRSFVAAISRDPKAIKFVASIIQMVHALRKELVVEGVETAEELALLRSVNARIVQGYYFSKPLSSEQAKMYIERSNSRLIVAAGRKYAPTQVS